MPFHPPKHTHTYAPGATVEFVDESTQLPPFVHGCDAHSRLSVAQFAPSQPIEQLHTYVPAPIDRLDELFDSVQLPPCRHGEDAHSSTSTSHLSPRYPTAHVHKYVAVLSLHAPPF